MEDHHLASGNCPCQIVVNIRSLDDQAFLPQGQGAPYGGYRCAAAAACFLHTFSAGVWTSGGGIELPCKYIHFGVQLLINKKFVVVSKRLSQNCVFNGKCCLTDLLAPDKKMV